MSPSPGQYPKDRLNPGGSRRVGGDAPSGPGSYRSRPVDRAVAVAERQTLTGALERVADRRKGVIVPEALYTDLGANVQTLMRTLILSVLSKGELGTAAELCSALVRLMALQPSRAWLDPQLILRVALLIHEKSGQDPVMMMQVRELVAAQGRWNASSIRHGAHGNAGDEADWQLVRELNALPLDFSPEIRSLIARSIIRQDILGARASLATLSRRSPEQAEQARRQLNRNSRELASLFGAELAPTRPMQQVRLEPRLTRPELPSARRFGELVTAIVWPATMVGATLLMVGMLVLGPIPNEDPRPAVEQICRVVGSEHPSCLTASALGTGLDHGDCRMAEDALPVLNDQLANFGLNRELAMLRKDRLGELRAPYDALEYAFAAACL